MENTRTSSIELKTLANIAKASTIVLQTVTKIVKTSSIVRRTLANIAKTSTIDLQTVADITKTSIIDLQILTNIAKLSSLSCRHWPTSSHRTASHSARTRLYAKTSIVLQTSANADYTKTSDLIPKTSDNSCTWSTPHL